jgi:hypothetical protein
VWQISDNLPEEVERLRDVEAAQRSSAISQETFRTAVIFLVKMRGLVLDGRR